MQCRQGLEQNREDDATTIRVSDRMRVYFTLQLSYICITRCFSLGKL
jgi:hypothetical protein